MSATGRIYQAVCEYVEEGYKPGTIADLISREFGVSKSYAFDLIDSIIGENW